MTDTLNLWPFSHTPNPCKPTNLSEIAATAPAGDIALRPRLLQLSADVVVADEVGGELAALLTNPQLEGLVHLHDRDVV